MYFIFQKPKRKKKVMTEFEVKDSLSSLTNFNIIMKVIVTF